MAAAGIHSVSSTADEVYWLVRGKTGRASVYSDRRMTKLNSVWSFNIPCNPPV